MPPRLRAQPTAQAQQGFELAACWPAAWVAADVPQVSAHQRALPAAAAACS